MKNPDISSLEHTSWRCQYHVVFAPKYRRMEIYREIRADIGVIIRKLCQQKGVEIIEANACPDHIHMLISIPPKYSVSCSTNHGISQRKKQPDDIRPTCKSQVQVWKQTFLGQRVFRRYSRTKQKSN